MVSAMCSNIFILVLNVRSRPTLLMFFLYKSIKSLVSSTPHSLLDFNTDWPRVRTFHLIISQVGTYKYKSNYFYKINFFGKFGSYFLKAT